MKKLAINSRKPQKTIVTANEIKILLSDLNLEFVEDFMFSVKRFGSNRISMYYPLAGALRRSNKGVA